MLRAFLAFSGVLVLFALPERAAADPASCSIATKASSADVGGKFGNAPDLATLTDRMGIGARSQTGFPQGRSSSSVPLDTPFWESVGGFSGAVYAVAEGSDGLIYVGGEFLDAGGNPDADYIATWDGEDWGALDGGVDGPVYSLLVIEDFDLVDYDIVIVGGGFSSVDGGLSACGIAVWDTDRGWNNYTGDMNSAVFALVTDSENVLYAGGYFSEAGGEEVYGVAAFLGFVDGGGPSEWVDLDGGMDNPVRALAIDQDDILYAGGYFENAGDGPSGKDAFGVAAWNPEEGKWYDLDHGMDGPVYALDFYQDGPFGYLAAGGDFMETLDDYAFGVAEWDIEEGGWYDLDVGVFGIVWAVAYDADGNLYVGGDFEEAGDFGIDAYGIAHFDFREEGWSDLDMGVYDPDGADVKSLTVASNGTLYAGGYFSEAGYDPDADGLAQWRAYMLTNIDGTDGLGNDVGWQMLATPVNARRSDIGDDIDLSSSSGSTLSTWNGTGWAEVLPNSPALQSGRGFIVYLFDDALDPVDGYGRDVVVMGNAPHYDVEVDDLDVNHEWHLLGNPYTNEYDLSALDLVGSGFQATIQIWDPVSGTFATITESPSDLDVIDPWQGFFVQRSEVGSGDDYLWFDFRGQSLPDPCVRLAACNQQLVAEAVRLGLLVEATTSAGTVSRDQLALYFREEALAGWDAYDATKLVPPRATEWVFLSVMGERSGQPVLLSQASFPPPSADEQSYPISLGGQGTFENYRLTWPTWEGVPDHWRIELVDDLTGNRIDLRQSTEFVVQAPIAEGRFRIAISAASATGTGEIPTPDFALDAAYPNPFRGETTLKYSLPGAGSVHFAVYDMLGRQVALLTDELQAAGPHEARFDASRLGAGMYVGVLSTDAGRLTRSMMVVK